MYGTARNVFVMAIFDSNKANVMMEKIEKGSKTKRVKIIYTLKPKHFSEDSDILDESFKNLLKQSGRQKLC